MEIVDSSFAKKMLKRGDRTEVVTVRCKLLFSQNAVTVQMLDLMFTGGYASEAGRRYACFWLTTAAGNSTLGQLNTR